MVIERRGVSSVLSLAFIVLGTVIGVSLLWAFVVKNTERSNEVVDTDCFTLDLEILDCKARGLCGYGSGLGSYNANVLISRGVGSGNLSGLRFIFEDPNGAKGVYDRQLNALTLNELERLQFKDPIEEIPVIGYPNLVRIAALLGKNKDVCPVSTDAEMCEIIHGPPLIGAIPNISSPFFGSPYGGNCCQFPANQSQCYNGLHLPNYPIDPVTGQIINPTGPITPWGTPPGNKTLCCQRNPNDGTIITFP